MELKHIDIANLSVSPTNMRVKGRAPDLTNILPSVRTRGGVPTVMRAASLAQAEPSEPKAQPLAEAA